MLVCLVLFVGAGGICESISISIPFISASYSSIPKAAVGVASMAMNSGLRIEGPCRVRAVGMVRVVIRADVPQE